jgi:DNA-binding transcriptional LysR family regulator
MDMNLLKYMAFIKTVEYGSFTRAAEALNYSQSGISRMIADLEKEWKVSLLERSRVGIMLTSEGTRLMPQIERVCSEYQILQQQVDELSGLKSGLIRIGTFSSVATHWLPGIIEAFQKDYPNIDFELLPGDYREIENWLGSGRVDCGFLRLPARAGLETFEVDKDELMAVIPQDHPLATAETVSLEELGREPFILLEKGENDEFIELFRRAGLSPNTRFTAWDDYAVMAMVEKGIGVSVLPELSLKRIPYDIAIKKLDIPVYRHIGIAMRNQRAASAAVKRLLDYLKYRG